MCNLSATDRDTVQACLAENFWPRNRPFTGQDVFEKLKTYAKVDQPSGEISAFVRELFNSGKMTGPRTRWASTQVTPQGPVLYFKIDIESKSTSQKSMRRTVKKIKRIIEKLEKEKQPKRIPVKAA